MANKPNNPSLWSKAKSLAKQKFDVYPSAYANGWAAKWYKSKGGTWRKAQYGMEVDDMAYGGEPQNAGFQALPDYVQNKIMANMAYGGYIPEMMHGGFYMEEGGEPDGGMAIGQIEASIDKLMNLRKFIQPDSDLEPWISSKLTLMDHYTDAVNDYMQYNPEAQEGKEYEEDEMMMMAEGGGIPQRYKNMGFNKVGVKKKSTRPGKKWMVLAKKGSQYKVVHGGYKGMQDFTQHRNEGRRKNFWNRMGGKGSSKATDPFSPLYWHKRFGTWEDGGEIQTYQEGGERSFLETVSQFLPGYETYLDLRDIVQGAFKGDRAQMNQGVIGLGQPFSGKALTGSLDYVTEKLTSKQNADYMSSKRSDIINMSEREKIKLFERYGRGGYDKWVKDGKPKLKKGGSTFSGNTWYEMGGGYIPEFMSGMTYQEGGKVDDVFANGGYVGYDGRRHMSNTPTWSGNVGYQGGGEIDDSILMYEALSQLPNASLFEYGMGGTPCYECGGSYAYGGIHINPANKGKFTASAKRAGMGVQEFAQHVMANKEDYSPTQVKRANFARNAAKWKKQEGGPMIGDEMDVTPEQLEYLRQMGYEFEMI